MKRVAIITNIPAPYRVDFFEYITNNSNYKYYIIYSAKNEDNRNWEIKENASESIVLNSHTLKIKKKNDMKYIHFPHGVNKILTSINPDVLIVSEYNPTSILACFWARAHHIQYISWTDGTLNSEKSISLFSKVIRREIVKNAAAYIASSTKSKEAQIAYGADEKKCFVSNISFKMKILNKNKETNNEPTKIVYVGQLIKRKGIDLLFDALKLVKNDWFLYIVGSGEECKVLREKATQYKIINKIEFCGYKQAEFLSDIYMQSDIFVLPTREDCYGLVILEAMSFGLPVIVSSWADASCDLVKNGKNGYIVDPYDAENFAQYIDNIICDDKLKMAMSINSRKFAADFSFEKVSKPYIAAIDSVIHNTKGNFE